MVLNSLAISEKEGLTAGSFAQHLSIKDRQAGSHQEGMSGRNVLFTIPPAHAEQNHIIRRAKFAQQSRHQCNLCKYLSTSFRTCTMDSAGRRVGQAKHKAYVSYL